MSTKVEKLKKNIPELRFPGFDEEWEQKRLGEVGRIVTGKTPSTTDKTLWGGDVLFVTPTDIANGEKYQRQTVRKVAVRDCKKILPSGSILYTCIASIGKMSLSTEPSISNQQINALITDEKSDNEFVYFALLNETPRIKAIQANTTLPIINKTEFSRIKIKLPSLDEQQKIAAFLTAADEWIENLKAQTGKWEVYKKGMMQKIFLGGAGQVAEVRFKDEDGNEFPDWEEKRLGEVAKIIMGQSPDSSSYNQKGEGRVLVQGNADLMRGQIYPRVWTTQPSKCSEVGDIIMTVRAPVGDIAWSSNNVCLGRGVCAIRTGDSLDAGYIYQWFLNFGQRWLRFGQGSMFSAVNSKDVSGLKFRFPSFPEQQKIAGFLTAIDEVIDSNQQKIARAEEWKKGLMQRMFV